MGPHGPAWARMGLAWARMGPHGPAWAWHGLGMGLAWAWHGLSMGSAWAQHGLSMGSAWARMGPAKKWHGTNRAWPKRGLNRRGFCFVKKVVPTAHGCIGVIYSLRSCYTCDLHPRSGLVIINLCINRRTIGAKTRSLGHSLIRWCYWMLLVSY